MPLGLAPLRPFGSSYETSQYLSPEEEASILRDLGSTALSGLGFVGNVLDTPGSIVRGLVNAAAGGSYDPSSIFYPSQRVSGRDVLETVGVLGPNRSGLDAGDVGGFLAEVGMDPLTYLTLGGSAFGRAGQVAKSAGMLDDLGRLAARQSDELGRLVGPRESRITSTLGDLLDLNPERLSAAEEAARGLGVSLDDIRGERLGGLFGVGIPFGPTSVPAMAQGQLAQKAAHGMDVLGNSLRWGPVGRGFNMLFNSDAAGEFSKLGQETAINANRLIREAVPEARMAAINARKAREPLLSQFATEAGQQADAELEKALDDIVQLTAETGDAGEAFTKFSPDFRPSEQLAGGVGELAETMRSANEKIYTAMRSKGGQGGWLEGSEMFQQFPRYVNRPNKPPALSQSKLLNQVSGSQLGRTEAIARLPAAVVNEILRTPEAWDKGASDFLLQNYGRYLGKGYESAAEHAEDLAQWVKRHDKKAFLEGGEQLFPTQPLENFARYQVGIRKASASIDAIHELFHKSLSDTGVPLKHAFDMAKMNGDNALLHFAKRFGRADVDNLLVDPEAVQAATSLAKYFAEPEWRGVIGGAVDWLTDKFKKGVTIPFPAFAVRNFFSGQTVNLTSGIVNTPDDIARYQKAFADAAKLARRNTDDEALLKYVDELEAYGVTGHHRSFMGVDTDAGRQVGALPGRPLKDLASGQTFREAREVIEEKPWRRIPGSSAARSVVDTEIGTMAKVNQQAEWYNRAAPYIYLREKGWAPQAAAEKVLELQFDYSRLSPFEKTYARRLAPFYSFSRKMAELTFNTLSERPGGALAQLIRATSGGRGDTTFLPDYVGETTAIPLGQVGENERFITGLGLAHEDPLSFLGGGARGAIMESLSRMNPLAKAPLEWATGQSFFQKGPLGGRPLEDLDPTVGRMFANIKELATGEETRFPQPMGGLPFGQTAEFVLANSPLARVATTARTVTDPRKYQGGLFPGAAMLANLGTGVRVSDISPATQEATMRDRATEAMRDIPGSRVFSRVYVPEEALEGLSQSQQEEAMRVNALLRVLGRNAKERAAERKAGSGRL